MVSVAVANIKGGSGKTTVATHLAAWFAGRHATAVLADLDRQQSSRQWVDRRPKELSRVRGLDLSRDWSPVEDVGAVVYDIPAAMKRKDLEGVVEVVDALVVPVLPSAFDEDGTRRFLELVAEFKPIRKRRLPMLAVANRVRGRTLAARRLQEFLGEVELDATATIRDAAAYAHLAAGGRSLFDEHDARSRELALDWTPVLHALASL